MDDDATQVCCDELDRALEGDFVRRGRGGDVWLVSSGGAALQKCRHCPMCGRALRRTNAVEAPSFVVVLAAHREASQSALAAILRDVFRCDEPLAIQRANELGRRRMIIATITDEAHARQLGARAKAAAATAGFELSVAVVKASAFDHNPEALEARSTGAGVDPNELVDVALTTEERRFLARAVWEWGGPAKCTEELAIAMGFASVEDLFSHMWIFADWIKSGTPMRRFDWLRSLLLAEIVVASTTLGSGLDWPITSGIPDHESITLLRDIQRKLSETCINSLVGAGLGTRLRRR